MKFLTRSCTRAITVGCVCLGWMSFVSIASGQSVGAPVVISDQSGPVVDSQIPSMQQWQELTHQLRVQQRQLAEQAATIDQIRHQLVEQSEVEPAQDTLPMHLVGYGLSGKTDGDGECCDPEPWLDIGAQYRLMYNASNFDFHPATISDNQAAQTFFNQRFRTWFEFHTNDMVSGYMQLETGHVLWGAAPEFPKTYGGPFSPAGDRVGVELRRGYLTYGNPESGMLRAGIQDWHDAFGESYTLGTFGAVDDYDSMSAVLANSVWDFSVGGLTYVGPAPVVADWNLNAGMYVLWEGDTHRADDAFLTAFDVDRDLDEDNSIGFSAYYLVDQGQYFYPITLPGGGAFVYESAWDAWLGFRVRTALRGIPVRGFVIYNTGRREEFGGAPDFTHDDVALKLELGAICFGPGKVSFQTLYSTGDGNPDETQRDGFRTIAQSERDNFGSQGYWSYLLLTSPHGPSDVNDLGVGLQNRGLGLFTIQGKYDYPICGRLSGTIAAGWLQSDAPNPVSGSRDMGTELANMFRYDFGGGLVADMGAGVFFTGDFYRAAGGGPPDDLYEAFTRVQLEF